MRQPTFYDALNKIIGEGKTGGGSTDGPISEIIFLDGVTKPTDVEVNAKLAELQADYPLQELRGKRDILLAETDWWASSDLTMSAKRKIYRQALRDLPKGLTTKELVNNVTWPTKPV